MQRSMRRAIRGAPRLAVPASLALLGLLLLANPAAAGASPVTRAEEQLRFALAVLCPRCADDMWVPGINRPMRRAIVAGAALEVARDSLAVAVEAGSHRPAAALRPVGRALQALESLDEEAAARQARRALRMLEPLPR